MKIKTNDGRTLTQEFCFEEVICPFCKAEIKQKFVYRKMRGPDNSHFKKIEMPYCIQCDTVIMPSGEQKTLKNLIFDFINSKIPFQ